MHFTLKSCSARVICFRSLAVMCCGLLASATANAALLSPGAAIFSTPEPDPVGGALVASLGPLPFVSATLSFTGTLTSQVFLSDASNPFGPGNYTFTYLLTSTGGPDPIDRLTVPGYGIPGLLTDASFQAPAPAGSVPPTIFDRSTGIGDVVGTSFLSPPIGAGGVSLGKSSALLVIQTNMNRFGLTTASAIDGSTAQVLSFAPLGLPVPEPTTLAFVFLGLIGTAIAARRRAD